MKAEPEHFHISWAAALNFFEVHIFAVVFLENLAALLGSVVACRLLLAASARSAAGGVDRLEVVALALLAEGAIGIGLPAIGAEAAERLSALLQTKEDENFIYDESREGHREEQASEDEHE